MDQFIGTYFPHFVIGFMILFMIVLSGLCIEDVFRGGRN